MFIKKEVLPHYKADRHKNLLEDGQVDLERNRLGVSNKVDIYWVVSSEQITIYRCSLHQNF